MPEEIVIVAGVGEVGRPLLRILSRTYECASIDVAPVQIERPCSVLHVCYPFQIRDFIGTTVAYIKKYQPSLTIIDSTLRVGTTRKVQERVEKPVVYSPVRGKHARMEQDMLSYRKFVAGFDPRSTQFAAEHFARAGFAVATFPTPEVGELSKLVETTWLGILVGWAQEVERMAAECGASYEDVNAFIKEINFLPSHVFSGRIGGHCVMPNIAILRDRFPSKLLDAVVESNEAKEQELQALAKNTNSNDVTEQDLSEYYRLPFSSAGSLVSQNEAGESGFFRFGSAAICYGRCGTIPTEKTACAPLHDASNDVRMGGCQVLFPFDPFEVIENLRKERYVPALSSQRNGVAHHAFVRQVYYAVREFLPILVRRQLQRIYLGDWRQLPLPHWPVDFTVETLHEDFLRLSMEAKGVHRAPFIWFWPEGAPNCLVMTHDVETAAGRDFTTQLMDLDDSFGIKSSFQIVPESRYEVPDGYIQEIRARGFELNIHDLNHDGSLFREREKFLRRAAKINEYVRKYQARGFRSGSMYRNQDWYDAFEFSYDMSVPNVAHLEPQRGGCCTVMPYFIGKVLELPLTATQDYSLFHILNDYSLDLWKRQIGLIRQKHGLMSFTAHPDYLIKQRARKVYEALLDYLRQMIAQEKIWMALPGEVDHWWRARSRMKLVPRGNTWVIEGPEKERARVAYAVRDGDRLTYELA